MRLRKQTSSGDYQFGHSLADFWHDQVEGVAQSIKTRLLLYRGEWFLDVREGTPWGGFPFNQAVVAQGEILGAHTQDTRDLALKMRVLDGPAVNNLLDYSSNLDSTRRFSVNMVVDTNFGPVTVSGSGTANAFSLAVVPAAKTATRHRRWY